MTFDEFVRDTRTIEVSYRITEDVYRAFQSVSRDFNPLHTDVYFAQQKGFSGLVMYGNILNCFISHFVGMVLPCKDVIIHSQDIQYRRPVFMGDEIVLSSIIEDVSEAVSTVVYKLKFYRQNGSKPQLVATGHVQVGKLS